MINLINNYKGMTTNWNKPCNRVLNERIGMLYDAFKDLSKRVKKLEDENKILRNDINGKGNKGRKRHKKQQEEKLLEGETPASY